MQKNEMRQKILNLRGTKINLEKPEDLSAEQIRELNKLLDFELARWGIEVEYNE